DVSAAHSSVIAALCPVLPGSGCGVDGLEAGVAELLTCAVAALRAVERAKPDAVDLAAGANHHWPLERGCQRADQRLCRAKLAERAELQVQRVGGRRWWSRQGGADGARLLWLGRHGNRLDAHAAGTLLVDAEFYRRCPGQVDQSLGVKRAAVVDAHDGALAVVQVGDARPGGQWQ